MDILKCTNLSKVYDFKIVLNQINFSIEKGRIVGILGPNGSGKTTLIKIINGLISPTSGTVEINGNKPGIASKKVISYLPDKNYLNLNFSLKELLNFYKDFYENFDMDKALKLTSDLKLSLDDKLKIMSKGTKEKVQLILVMSRKADLYILDEPIGGVDPAIRDYILKTVLNNLDENASLLISTHLISEVEDILDQVIFLKDGSIILNESKDDIKTKYQKSVDSLFREEFKC